MAVWNSFVHLNCFRTYTHSIKLPEFTRLWEFPKKTKYMILLLGIFIFIVAWGIMVYELVKLTLRLDIGGKKYDFYSNVSVILLCIWIVMFWIFFGIALTLGIIFLINLS